MNDYNRLKAEVKEELKNGGDTDIEKILLEMIEYDKKTSNVPERMKIETQLLQLMKIANFDSVKDMAITIYNLKDESDLSEYFPTESLQEAKVLYREDRKLADDVKVIVMEIFINKDIEQLKKIIKLELLSDDINKVKNAINSVNKEWFDFMNTFPEFSAVVSNIEEKISLKQQLELN